MLLGLTTAGSAVLLRTDSETAVSALIRRANLGIRIVTQRAPPQGHESVGGVERAVRTLKELFSTIRLDLRDQGYDLKRSPRAFELGLIYCAAMHTIIIRRRLMERSLLRSWFCRGPCLNVHQR